jgi:hypothetical protein
MKLSELPQQIGMIIIRNHNVGPVFLRDFQDAAAEPLNIMLPAEILANSVHCEVENIR